MRYELQIKNGREWQDVIEADSIAALKPHATNLAADYRVIDTEKEKVRSLEVTISSCVLADGGWDAR